MVVSEAPLPTFGSSGPFSWWSGDLGQTKPHVVASPPPYGPWGFRNHALLNRGGRGKGKGFDLHNNPDSPSELLRSRVVLGQSDCGTRQTWGEWDRVIGKVPTVQREPSLERIGLQIADSVT
jgi:hypothetical protein